MNLFFIASLLLVGSFGRSSHRIEIKGLVQFLFRHQFLFKNDLANAFVRGERFLGDRRGFQIADVGVERRDERGTPLGKVMAAVGVGLNAFDTALGEDAQTVFQNL
jgi:hypothetical protein